MKNNIILIFLLFLVCSNTEAGEKGFHFSTSGMFLVNSTSQGGQGPQGSSILTHTELVYHGTWWGVGTFFSYDLQGSTETDIAIGPKLELHLGPLYTEFAYAPFLQRSYTDRTIARQTGYELLYGLGVRLNLSSSSGGSGSFTGFFIQSSYKYRFQFINKQDGTALSQPIQQVDGYPTFGIGYVF